MTVSKNTKSYIVTLNGCASYRDGDVIFKKPGVPKVITDSSIADRLMRSRFFTVTEVIVKEENLDPAGSEPVIITNDVVEANEVDVEPAIGLEEDSNVFSGDLGLDDIGEEPADTFDDLSELKSKKEETEKPLKSSKPSGKPSKKVRKAAKASKGSK